MEKPRHALSNKYYSKGIFNNLESFEDLEYRILSLPSQKERGDAFEVFAEAYLATQKTAQARQVYPFQSVPLGVLQKLSLDTGKDMGVDGVIVTKSGEYHAYQAKFRSGRPSLTWRELSTFMGLSDRVDQRILLTNCDDMPSVMNERAGFFCIRGNDLDRLEKRDFDDIQEWLGGEFEFAPRKTPHPHQEQALEAITKGLRVNDRATVLMACGTGKTLVALWTAERMGCRNVLVLVPSLALLRQTLHEWLKETRWDDLAYLCVCSDPTVTRNVDELKVRQSDVDFPVSTDSSVVSKFLGRDGAETKIVFSTYKSAQVVAEGMDGWGSFDLGIFDEAHKTAGREGTKFAYPLNDVNLPVAKRLFMTATPRHYDIRLKDKEGDSRLVFSMDVPEIYGPVVYDLPFSRASSLGIICDYKVLISVVTSEMLNKELLKRGEVIVDGDVVHAQHVANQVALKQAVERYGVGKTITFHRTVKEAKTFSGTGAEGISNHLPHYHAYHVSGSQRTSDRERIMKEFRHTEKSLISNARCLTEGVDVPAVDMVAFLTPKRSRIDIVQATGRAMRKSPDLNKTTGYVLVPLFLEMERRETVEEAVEKGKFEEIWNVLQAMKEQDKLLAEIINEMRENIGKTGSFDGRRFDEKVEILGPRFTLEQIRESITSICIDKLGDAWDERYGELIFFKEKYGHCIIPQKHPEYKQLRIWVKRQRSHYKQGTLDQDRIDRLEKLGFVWDPIEAAWEERFAALVRFKEQSGHCNVPHRYSENKQLGVWVSTLRYSYKQGTLDKDRIDRLEKLGFAWDLREAVWEEMFAALVRYKEQEDHCNVPLRYPENKQLGSWVRSQRDSYKQGTLDQDRIDRLEKLGFVWDLFEAAWEEMFDALVRFKGKEGHCNVPRGYPENKQLATWVANHRNSYKQGTLGQNRITRLEKLGFVWEIYEVAWEEMFAVLVRFKEQSGHCNVPFKYPENPELALWARRQRSFYSRGKLGQDRITRLEKVGFVWKPLETTWEEMFEALVRFKEQEGHCNVPLGYSENKQLGNWVARQRKFHNQGTLDQDRITRLAKVGFVWEPLKSFWEEMFDVLVRFKEQEGHCNVPQRYPENKQLGSWVANQRSSYNQSTLGQDRIARLEKLGFVWEPREAAWEEMFEALVRFKGKEGHCNLPQNCPRNQKLGHWVWNQRGLYSRGQLGKDRIARLEELGFKWKLK